VAPIAILWLPVSLIFGFPGSLTFVIFAIRRQELVRRERVGPDIKHLAGHTARISVKVTVESPQTEDDRTHEQAGEAVIPLLAEEITVSKQTVETGRVQVSRITHEREQLIDELLEHDLVEIDRIPINRKIDTMPSVREEGDTVVIPIVEEMLVIERRLLLKEEVRVRRVRSTERLRESVTLRYHEAVVTRVPVQPPAAESPEASAKPQQSKEEG
jgi:uncharacterized protein (TIGR02271 family)